jgi:hypothetical protein
MDIVSPPPYADGRVVLFAMAAGEFAAMCALMLEMAGLRVLPLAGLTDVEVRAREILPYAIVADVRRGEPREWNAIRRLRADPLTGAARIVVMIDDAQVIPPDIAGQSLAGVLRWPFPLTDVLRSVLGP